MNRWSTKRKRFIFSLVVVVLVILIGIPAYLLFYKAPTCTDGKQNGDETGVDCGGSCRLLCSVESLPIIQEGDVRILTVAPNVYEAVVIFKNPNAVAEIYRAGYTIKLYEASGSVPVKVIESSTYVPKNSSFVVFEGPFALTDSVPARATFDWKSDTLIWQKINSVLPNIGIQDKLLSKASTTPRLDVSVLNKSLDSIANLELVVLISDTFGNVFAASKTFIGDLAGGASSPAVFTWPRGFTGEVGLIDIIPRILPDRSFIR